MRGYSKGKVANNSFGEGYKEEKRVEHRQTIGKEKKRPNSLFSNLFFGKGGESVSSSFFPLEREKKNLGWGREAPDSAGREEGGGGIGAYVQWGGGAETLFNIYPIAKKRENRRRGTGRQKGGGRVGVFKSFLISTEVVGGER